MEDDVTEFGLALLGPPQRHLSEVWQGWGRFCTLRGGGYIETWELLDMYADPDNPANWRLVMRERDAHPLVNLWRLVFS